MSPKVMTYFCFCFVRNVYLNAKHYILLTLGEPLHNIFQRGQILELDFSTRS